MRIAICFSGAIRRFSSCYPSIYRTLIMPNIELHNQVDVFCHLWSYGDKEKMKEIRKEVESEHKMVEDDCTTEYLLEKLDPYMKDYVIEEFSAEKERYTIEKCGMTDILNDKEYKDNVRMRAVNCIGMYYKIFEANQLKKRYEEEHDFIYDIVIRARLDFLWFEEDLFANNITLDKGLNPNTIVLVKDDFATDAKWNSNDKFFYGSSAMMDAYCDIYNNIKRYYENKTCLIEGQNLALTRIRDLKLIIEWIGSKKTYIKCMSYNAIAKRSKYPVVMDHCLSSEATLILLKEGYIVTGYDLINSVAKKKMFDILNCYQKFTLITKKR